MLRILMLCLLFCIQCAGQENTREGIRLFHEKKYDAALKIFESKGTHQNLEALIGQLFCNVALGNTAQIDPTIRLIAQQLEEFGNCDTPPEKGPMTQEKQLLLYQCRRHVREVANQMRQTVEKLVRDTVPGVFQKIKILRQLYPFIDALEQTGIDCCQSNFPLACCLDPMLEQIQSWKSFGIEKGQLPNSQM